ncbi:hypothetical protein [Mycobacterium sp. HUMS_1102779]|uniref:hypothetical protein n=1 Tax=Mycobacterium sp. HUMS_1102779 TaxID=3383487 RepID=UPI00389AD4D0
MKLWVQIKGRDEDAEFPDVDYEILNGGVLMISSGNDIRLYSPHHWQEVMIDTSPTAQRDEPAPPNDDIKWQ